MTEQRTIYTGGQVFFGDGEVPRRADFAVERGRFVSIGTPRPGDKYIDLNGLHVMPGFIDCHVHLVMDEPATMSRISRPFSYQFYSAAQNMQRTLHQGITTVRDAGGSDLGMKQAVDDGLIAGPRLVISVNMISSTGGHGDGWHVSGCNLPFFPEHPGRPSGVADGTDQMRIKAREMLRAGADALKVCATGGVLSPGDSPLQEQLTLQELTSLVEEAEMRGAHVLAHAQGGEGIKNALRAGVRSIEHGIYLDDECIEMMLAQGTFLVPTLAAPRAVIAAGETGNVTSDVLEKAREVVDIHADSIRRASLAGVKIAMGTDSGVCRHGDNLAELVLMKEIGMTNAQVLAASTTNAAGLLGMGEQVGRIAEGYYADFTLASPSTNPTDELDFVTLSDRILTVVKEGKVMVERRPGTGWDDAS